MKKTNAPLLPVSLFGLFAILVLTGCGSDPVQPLLEPEVINQTDTFQFQATTSGQTTQSFQYAWENTGTTANVDQSTVLNSGTAVVTITDANGTQVYTHDLNQDGSFSSAQGVSGMWTIRVVLDKAVGGLNFRVQKP